MRPRLCVTNPFHMAVTLSVQPDELMLSRNPIPYRLTSDLGGSDIRFIIRLEIESQLGLGDFTQVGEFVKVADPAAKRADFDISNELDDLLDYIEPNGVGTLKATGLTHCKRYRIQYADFDENTPPTFNTSPERYALKGGWYFRDFPGRTTLLPTGNKLLTTRPQQNRQFYIGQYEWMWLLPENDGEQILLTITVNFADGSQQQLTASYGTTVKYLPVGLPLHDSVHEYSQLNPNDAITTISFAALGEEITVRNSFESYAFLREFLYANSLGGFDSLVTYGGGELEETITKTRSESFVPFSYGVRFRPFKAFNAEMLSRQTQRIGYRSRAERDAAKDALLSERIYLREGNGYVPILIAEADITNEPDGDFRYRLEFEFEYAFPNVAIPPQ